VSEVFQPSAYSQVALQNGGERQAAAAALAQRQQEQQAALHDSDEDNEVTTPSADGESHVSTGAIAVALAFVAIPTLIVAPWVVGKFKPEWSYGKRVAAGLVASAVGGFVSRTTGLVKVEKQYVPVGT